MDLVNDPSVCHSGNWCVFNSVRPGYQTGGSYMRSPAWPSQRTVYVKLFQKWRSDYIFDVLGKIVFLPATSNDWYLRWDAVTPTTAHITINAVSGTGYDHALGPNLNSMTVMPGQWYELEWQTTMISAPGACDGSTDVWVNGIHTLSYSGLCNIDWPNKITQIMPSGYYNGTSPVNSMYWLDDIVVSDSFIPFSGTVATPVTPITPPVVVPPVVTTGTVNVIVNVNNSAGGTASAGSFTVSASGAGATPPTFAGNSAGTSITVNSGSTYAISVSSIQNYVATMGPSCTGSIPAGITATCTIIETYSPTSTVAPTTPAPTANLAIAQSSVTSGQSTTLSWSSTNATSCTASGGWSGTLGTLGAQAVTPTANTTYSITCNGSGGNSPTQSVTVAVTAVTTAATTQSVTAGSVTYVQGNASNNASQSLSVGFAGNTSAGDLIVVGLGFKNTVNFSSISDSQGNVFTQVGSEIVTPGGGRTRMYYAKNIKGGADTVTTTLSGAPAYHELYVMEYHGANASSPLDTSAQNTGPAGTVTSGNAVTSSANDTLVAFCYDDSGCTVGSGFNTRLTMDSNLIEDKALSSAGSYAGTATSDAGWAMIMGAFKP